MVNPRATWVLVAAVSAVALVALGIGTGAISGVIDGAGGTNPLDGTPNETRTGDGEPNDVTFEPAPASAGIDYAAGDDGTSRRKMLTDVGVFAADVDGDGWTDVLATGGEKPVLFGNENGTFRRLEGSLPALNRSVRSALFLDADNDGDRDLLLLSDGRAPLFLRNDGDGSFRRAPAGFDRPLAVPVGATAADFDGDGCLDVFVVQNGPWSDRIPAGMSERHVPPDADNGLRNVLYRGTCDGFERADATGIAGARWSLATSAVDFDGDGLEDIHVANDFNNDVIYRNSGNLTFERVVLGKATDRNGMSSEIADVNGDGNPDVFVTNIYYPPVINETLETKFSGRARGNNLLVNRGNGTFEDRAAAYGVRKGGWGWAAALQDFNHDGHLDLYHATMRRTFDGGWSPLSEEEQRTVRRQYRYFRYPVVRAGNGSAFEPVGGLFAGFDEHDGSGVATVDFDRDGDLDLVAANRSGPFRLYENAISTHCRALEIAVRKSGRTAIGARVTIDGGRTQYATAETDFLSQDARITHFAVPRRQRVNVSVTWPDGSVSAYANVSAGNRLTIDRTGGITNRQPFESCQRPD